MKPTGGFKDVMATFDATRPIVAAMAIGVGRAALDYVRDFLQEHKVPIRYGISPRRLTTVERDFMEMEVQLKAARLLTWRAAWMLDIGDAQQPGGFDGKSEGRQSRDVDHSKSGRVARTNWLFAQGAGRKMDARRENQRHFRGHAADQSA